MKPIKFEQVNRILNKPADMTDEECQPLPVYTDGRDCLSCWKLTFWERVSCLIHGRVWLCILSGETQPPVWLDVRKDVFKNED
jgi:hypothetical protein